VGTAAWRKHARESFSWHPPGEAAGSEAAAARAQPEEPGTKASLAGRTRNEESTKVSFLHIHQIATNNNSEYATGDHFRKLFAEDEDSLYLLSLLLTANREKADQCFVAGLDDCVNEDSVFSEWARSWARRVIVRNAVRIMAPRAGSSRRETAASDTTGEGSYRPRVVLSDGSLASVLALEDFERFIYVLTVLEGYADQNCAVLLSTSQQEVREARCRALKQIADFDMEKAAPGSDFSIAEASQEMG
jgi:hypothetical protein